MTSIADLRGDLATFARAVGRELTPTQASALELRTRTTVVIAPRQAGKSRSLAVLALHRAFREPGLRVLIVSAGEDAARRLLGEARSLATASPLLRPSVVDEGAGLLVLSNGSEIRSVPASERAVRGWTVGLLLIDEAAKVEDALILEAAIPTTAARPDARIVLASSPGPREGAFYVHAMMGEAGSPHVSTFRWPLTEAPWISQDVIEGARASLPVEAFAREYLGEFADVGADERVVARDWIEAAHGRVLAPVGPVVYGLDVARHGGDETVLVRVQGGVARLVMAARAPDLMHTAARVAGLAGDAPVHVDVAGLGYGVADRLVQLGVQVVHFQAAGRASVPARYLNRRAEAWWVAREAFRTGVVDLDPKDGVLAKQLAGVGYGLASSGAIQIQGKDQMRGGSPDRADALVIALFGARGLAVQEEWRRGQRERDLRPRRPRSGIWRDAVLLPQDIRGVKW